MLETQGSCTCAAWATWEDEGVCGECDEGSYTNCKQTRVRDCQDAYHFNPERGLKDGEPNWSSDGPISCDGEGTKKIPCSGIYGSWSSWTDCDKTCINKDEVSTRTRQRNCNDTIINTGKIFLTLNLLQIKRLF